MQQPRVTFADAAYVVLAEALSPLHYKDLAQSILEQKLFVSRGKTPAQTLRSQISREVRTRGEESRFVNRDQGMIELSEKIQAAPDRVLIRWVLTKSGVSEEEAAARADQIPSGPVASDASAEPPVVAVAEPAPADEPAPAEEAKEVVPDESVEERAFIPVEVERKAHSDDEDEEEFDGTFATAEHDPVVYDAPDALGDEDEDDGENGKDVARPPTRDEDSEQDFLSVGRDLRDEMESSQYEASMDELAPIVVPPHEGGAAEIARLPQGGRTVLIIKVVRRRGKAWVELVEELESLVSGVVGRLLMTVPGRDLPELIDAMLMTEKVVDESFEYDEDDEDVLLVRRARRTRHTAPRR